MENLNFVNVFEDSYELYKLCKSEGWTDLEFDEWEENGGNYDFFEGDPDIFKIKGETGYFARVGNTVFYLIDEYGKDAEGVLKGFFNSCVIVNYGYMTIEHCNRKAPEWCQNWSTWDKMENGIAHRGGVGYVYNIYPLSFKSGHNAD